VAEVRDILRSIDWCEVILCERETNLGLGRAILTGVTEVLTKHESAIIFEDDLICVPGTYKYLCAALSHYHHDHRVMSVTGWTHPRLTPSDITDQPYFDGRAECWVWGTWTEAWDGMQEDARSLMQRCETKGIDVTGYGSDLPEMAAAELQRNIWAVRFLYLHILKGGLCLRPPWSMVEHIGFDADGTNVKRISWVGNPPLKLCPPIPQTWPEPIENSECAELHRRAIGALPPITRRIYRYMRRIAAKTLRSLS
jgi:hypothetical protein